MGEHTYASSVNSYKVANSNRNEGHHKTQEAIPPKRIVPGVCYSEIIPCFIKLTTKLI